MHELDFTTGTAGIAIRFDGETPWHGYGNRVQDGATLDEWRIAARCNWDVMERKIFFEKEIAVEAPDGYELKTVKENYPNRKALLRSDTQAPLSIVSDNYEVFQPADVFEFYRDLIEENGFIMDTAGSLMEGKRIWALARIGESTRLYGQDRVDGYLLLATSYDGSMATVAKLTSVRVVCNNTLEFANDGAGTEFKLSHNHKFDADAAKGALGLTKEAWEKYENDMNVLASTKVDEEQAIAYFVKVLGAQAFKLDDNGDPQPTPTFLKMVAAYEGSPGAQLRSAKGTAWGLVNGVTFYQDHMARNTANGSRLNSSWFGTGAQRKRKAFEEALKLAA